MWWIWWAIAILFGLAIVYSVLPNVWTRLLGQGVFSRGKLAEPAVALTFDDGPDPRYTPRLLDELQAAGVHASFFVIAAKAVAHPEIVDRMLAEGHDVEVHGYSHAMVPLLSPRRTLQQFRDSQKVLSENFGIHPYFYRPTWGLCNLWTLLRNRSLRLATWSIMVGDWRVETVETLLQRILSKLHSGAVIVLHDSDETFGAQPGAPESVIALIGPLATALRERGYTVQSMRPWTR